MGELKRITPPLALDEEPNLDISVVKGLKVKLAHGLSVSAWGTTLIDVAKLRTQTSADSEDMGFCGFDFPSP